MHSFKCSTCGFVGWADTEVCKKCGVAIVSNPNYSPGPNPAFDSYAAGMRPNVQLKQGLAICSLVIGILNLFTLGLLGVGALLGIVLAAVALSRVKRNPFVYGGKGYATAGLVTSALSLVIIVPIGIIAAIAIPNLIAARRAANEGSTIHALRQVSAAQATYQSLHGTYGTLEELGAEQLVEPSIAAGVRHGYRLVADVSRADSENPPGFKLVAVPLTYPNSGRRSFFVDETGIIRAADMRGGEATQYDDPLNVDDEYPPLRRARSGSEY